MFDSHGYYPNINTFLERNTSLSEGDTHLLNRINLYPDECHPQELSVSQQRVASGRLSSNYNWMAVDFLTISTENIACHYRTLICCMHKYNVMSKISLGIRYGFLTHWQLRLSG